MVPEGGTSKPPPLLSDDEVDEVGDDSDATNILNFENLDHGQQNIWGSSGKCGLLLPLTFET